MQTKQTSKKKVYWISVAIVAVIAGLSLKVVHAWAPPTSTAPTGNVAAPITTSTFPQHKDGPLKINGKFEVNDNTDGICLNGSCITKWKDLADKLGIYIPGAKKDFPADSQIHGWNVPDGVSTLHVELWGGGGGASNGRAMAFINGFTGYTPDFSITSSYANPFPNFSYNANPWGIYPASVGGSGGSGAYALFDLNVTPGQLIYVKRGAGGLGQSHNMVNDFTASLKGGTGGASTTIIADDGSGNFKSYSVAGGGAGMDMDYPRYGFAGAQMPPFVPICNRSTDPNSAKSIGVGAADPKSSNGVPASALSAAGKNGDGCYNSDGKITAVSKGGGASLPSLKSSPSVPDGDPSYGNGGTGVWWLANSYTDPVYTCKLQYKKADCGWTTQTCADPDTGGTYDCSACTRAYSYASTWSDYSGYLKGVQDPDTLWWSAQYVNDGVVHTFTAPYDMSGLTTNNVYYAWDNNRVAYASHVFASVTGGNNQPFIDAGPVFDSKFQYSCTLTTPATPALLTNMNGGNGQVILSW